MACYYIFSNRISRDFEICMCIHIIDIDYKYQCLYYLLLKL